LVKPLHHKIAFHEQAWYERSVSHVRSRDLNPANPFYEELLKEIFEQDDEYWTTLGTRLTDDRADQIAYDSVFTLREAYRNQPMILQHFRLGTIWYNVHILSDLIHLLHKRE
jgi:type III secretory pathway component EscR